MSFNSIHFLLFFVIVTSLYFAIPHRFRWILLLIASYYFYMSWNAKYAILILSTTIITYFAGLGMDRALNREIKRVLLIASIVISLGILFAFKYFNFFNSFIGLVIERLNITYPVQNLNILLPIGISFYTFQSLSYAIEVYQGRKKAENHFGIYALYVSFFPQLVAGPIERSTRLLPQFFEKKEFDYIRVTDGLKRITWGFFKKLVIADRLAFFVNSVFNQPQDYRGISFILATIFFGFQIYCDFSGYSDIAIGSAKIMGYDLMDNFRRPYFSKSIPEFWTRWHISLSTWFRDYLYIPLGGNRVKKRRWYFNLLFTFLVSGLWHGASWTFLLWGLLHGIFVVVSIMTNSLRERVCKLLKLNLIPIPYRNLRILVTFSMVSFAWIFFRANSISDAYYIVTHLFSGGEDLFNLSELKRQILMGQNEYDLLVAILSIGFMEFVHAHQRRGDIWRIISKKWIGFRWAIYVGLFWGILLFGKFEAQQFIYFQF